MKHSIRVTQYPVLMSYQLSFSGVTNVIHPAQTRAVEMHSDIQFRVCLFQLACYCLFSPPCQLHLPGLQLVQKGCPHLVPCTEECFIRNGQALCGKGTSHAFSFFILGEEYGWSKVRVFNQRLHIKGCPVRCSYDFFHDRGKGTRGG